MSGSDPADCDGGHLALRRIGGGLIGIPLFLANHPKLSFRPGNYGSSNAPSTMTQGVVQNGYSATHWGRLFAGGSREARRHPKPSVTKN